MPPPKVSKAPPPLEPIRGTGTFEPRPTSVPVLVPFDTAHLMPYLDYSHWTLMESAYRLCGHIPRGQSDFIGSDMNAGGAEGHRYRRLKDAASLPPHELACVPSAQWVGNSRVRKADAIWWALAQSITLPPELAACEMEPQAATVGAESAPGGTAGPLPLTTGDIAFCFAGLRWKTETEWKKPLGDKPKWLEACIVIPGERGVSETRWSPVCIGAALVRAGHGKPNSVRAKFQTEPLLKPWLDEWKTYEADNFDSN